jgi:SAM-dependent methyltransferase
VVASLPPHPPLVPELPARLARGCEVLDVGCGSGQALARMAEAFPNSRFTGVDSRPRAIELARIDARGVANLRFEARGATNLERVDAFDLITAFDAIHDRPIRAVLERAGRCTSTDVLMQEIAGTGAVDEDAAHPLATFLYTMSCLHCMTVSLAAGGAGLGAMWGERLARRMLADAGFGSVEVRSRTTRSTSTTSRGRLKPQVRGVLFRFGRTPSSTKPAVSCAATRPVAIQPAAGAACCSCASARVVADGETRQA